MSIGVQKILCKLNINFIIIVFNKCFFMLVSLTIDVDVAFGTNFLAP